MLSWEPIRNCLLFLTNKKSLVLQRGVCSETQNASRTYGELDGQSRGGQLEPLACPSGAWGHLWLFPRIAGILGAWWLLPFG